MAQTGAAGVDNAVTDETGISRASLAGGTVYQFTDAVAIPGNVRFSLGAVNKSQPPLPVELLSFTATVSDNNQVELTWSTATEKNSDYFEAQRSLDGLVWETVGIIEGAGNSPTIKNYRLMDEHPYNILSYYRLKQWDHDGRAKHFPVVMLDLTGVLNDEVQIYPNPASDFMTVQGNPEDLESIQIYDLYGREMNLQALVSRINPFKLIIDLSFFREGNYVLRTKNTIRRIIKTGT